MFNDWLPRGSAWINTLTVGRLQKKGRGQSVIHCRVSASPRSGKSREDKTSQDFYSDSSPVVKFCDSGYWLTGTSSVYCLSGNRRRLGYGLQAKDRRIACLPGDWEYGPGVEGWRVRASVKSAARTDVCSPVQPLCKAASSKAGTANWTECQLDYEIWRINRVGRRCDLLSDTSFRSYHIAGCFL